MPGAKSLDVATKSQTKCLGLLKSGNCDQQLLSSTMLLLKDISDTKFPRELLKALSAVFLKETVIDSVSFVNAANTCCSKITDDGLPKHFEYEFHRCVYNIMWKLKSQCQLHLVCDIALQLEMIKPDKKCGKQQLDLNLYTYNLLKSCITVLAKDKVHDISSAKVLSLCKLTLHFCSYAKPDAETIVAFANDTLKLYAHGNEGYDLNFMIDFSNEVLGLIRHLLEDKENELQLLSSAIPDGLAIILYSHVSEKSFPLDFYIYNLKKLGREMLQGKELKWWNAKVCLLQTLNEFACHLDASTTGKFLAAQGEMCRMIDKMSSEEPPDHLTSYVLHVVFKTINDLNIRKKLHDLHAVPPNSVQELAKSLLKLLARYSCLYKVPSATPWALINTKLKIVNAVVFLIQLVLRHNMLAFDDLFPSLKACVQETVQLSDEIKPIGGFHLKLWSGLGTIFTFLYNLVTKKSADVKMEVLELVCTYTAKVKVHDKKRAHESFLANCTTILSRELTMINQHMNALKWLVLAYSLERGSMTTFVKKCIEVKSGAIKKGDAVMEKCTIKDMLELDEIYGIPIECDYGSVWHYLQLEFQYLCAYEHCKTAAWNIVSVATELAETLYEDGLAAEMKALYTMNFGDTSCDYSETVKILNEGCLTAANTFLCEVQLGLVYYDWYRNECDCEIKKQQALAKERKLLPFPPDVTPGEEPEPTDRHDIFPIYFKLSLENEINSLIKLEKALYWLSKGLLKVDLKSLGPYNMDRVICAVSTIPHIWSLHGFVAEHMKAVLLYYEASILFEDNIHILRATSELLKAVPNVHVKYIEEGNKVAATMSNDKSLKYEALNFVLAKCWRNYRLCNFEEGFSDLISVLEALDPDLLTQKVDALAAEAFYLASLYTCIEHSSVPQDDPRLRLHPATLAIIAFNFVKRAFLAACSHKVVSDFKVVGLIIDISMQIGDLYFMVGYAYDTEGYYLFALKLAEEFFLPMRCAEVLAEICTLYSLLQRPDCRMIWYSLKNILFSWTTELKEVVPGETCTSKKIWKNCVTRDISAQNLDGSLSDLTFPVTISTIGNDGGGSPVLKTKTPEPFWFNHTSKCHCKLCLLPGLSSIVIKTMWYDAECFNMENDLKMANCVFRRAMDLGKVALQKMPFVWKYCIEYSSSPLLPKLDLSDHELLLLVFPAAADLELTVARVKYFYVSFLVSLHLLNAAEKIQNTLCQDLANFELAIVKVPVFFMMVMKQKLGIAEVMNQKAEDPVATQKAVYEEELIQSLKNELRTESTATTSVSTPVEMVSKAFPSYLYYDDDYDSDSVESPPKRPLRPIPLSFSDCSEDSVQELQMLERPKTEEDVTAHGKAVHHKKQVTLKVYGTRKLGLKLKLSHKMNKAVKNKTVSSSAETSGDHTPPKGQKSSKVLNSAAMSDEVFISPNSEGTELSTGAFKNEDPLESFLHSKKEPKNGIKNKEGLVLPLQKTCAQKKRTNAKCDVPIQHRMETRSRGISVDQGLGKETKVKETEMVPKQTASSRPATRRTKRVLDR